MRPCIQGAAAPKSEQLYIFSKHTFDCKKTKRFTKKFYTHYPQRHKEHIYSIDPPLH